MSFGVFKSIGAFILWTFYGFKIPYKDIRYGDYPCYGVGFSFIGVIIIIVFYLPIWFGFKW
tara:strand:+ start:189 stop:371 length:183 start_codon:yes stop_codon:yes gene_type:complete